MGALEGARALDALQGGRGQQQDDDVDGARDAERDRDIDPGGAQQGATIDALGVGSIIVPLPGAIADEQSANAQSLVDAGAATKIPQAELTPERLAECLAASTRESLLAMAQAARKIARPDAARRVADACIALGTPAR